MIVGFTGAAATGKSWAAKELAAQLSFGYVPSKAADIAAKLKFDINTPHDFDERIDYQWHVLMQMKEDVNTDNLIFDRCPVDLMAYAINAFYTMDDVKEDALNAYLKACRSYSSLFDKIILISPPDDDLLGLGEYKPGRLKAEAHADNHRLFFDRTLKILLAAPEYKNKLIVVPEDCHYNDRIEFLKKELS